MRRLLVCSGKVAVDLLTSPLREQSPHVAVCRVEQLYPLPVRDLLGVIEGYPALEEVVWVQEEPENMGAWEFVRSSLEGLAGSRRLSVLARPRSSSPAEGSAARHAKNQEELLRTALAGTPAVVRREAPNVVRALSVRRSAWGGAPCEQIVSRLRSRIMSFRLSSRKSVSPSSMRASRSG